MKFEVHVYHHFIGNELSAELGKIRHAISQTGALIMATLADLQTKVTNNTTVISSALTLIQGLKAQLDAAIASNDPAALQALSDQLDSADSSLAAAVAANTPAAPAPTPAPAPAPAPADGGDTGTGDGTVTP